MKPEFHRRVFLVIAAWVWMFIALPLVALIIGYVKGIPLSLDKIINMFYGEPYLASCVEFASVEGLPLAITSLFKENKAAYGLQRKSSLKSLVLISSMGDY